MDSPAMTTTDQDEPRQITQVPSTGAPKDGPKKAGDRKSERKFTDLMDESADEDTPHTMSNKTLLMPAWLIQAVKLRAHGNRRSVSSEVTDIVIRAVTGDSPLVAYDEGVIRLSIRPTTELQWLVEFAEAQKRPASEIVVDAITAYRERLEQEDEATRRLHALTLDGAGGDPLPVTPGYDGSDGESEAMRQTLSAIETLLRRHPSKAA